MASQVRGTTVGAAPEVPVLTARFDAWTAVDWAIATYATYVAVVAVVYREAVAQWPFVLGWHAALVMALLLMPPRGAAWEQTRADDPAWRTRLRRTARFLRYTFPALLLTPFFEEVALTVNAASPGSPYWFESYLLAADRALFGGTPAVILSQAGGPLLDEVMHALYFGYYPLITLGIVIAWRGWGGRGTPGPGFRTAMTCMMLGFFLSYIWYPFLPARGPWEHPEIMAGLRPFGGWVFTPVIEVIIANAAVSGGCFPSAHVSGTWALTFGLAFSRPKTAFWFGLFALGLSVACVYTRYHHAVDVLAGLMVAAVAAAAGYLLTRRAGQDDTGLAKLDGSRQSFASLRHLY